MHSWLLILCGAAAAGLLYFAILRNGSMSAYSPSKRDSFELIDDNNSTNINYFFNNEQNIEEFLDWTKCPARKPLAFYVYANNNAEEDNMIRSLMDALTNSEYATEDPKEACIFIAVVDNKNSLPLVQNWTNHVIISLDENLELPQEAIRMQANLKKFRRGIDIHANLRLAEDDESSEHIDVPAIGTQRSNLVCTVTTEAEAFPGTAEVRVPEDQLLLRNCSFTVVLQQQNFAEILFYKIFSVLNAGSVPIIASNTDIPLPFEEVIDWNSISLRVPPSRLHNIKEFVSRFDVEEIFDMQRKGRIALDTYLRDSKGLVRGVVGELSARLHLPYNNMKPTNIPMGVENRREQLTVVMMTFRRDEYLNKTLLNVLNGLDIVVIIWNDVGRPIPDFSIISAPVVIVKPAVNSLNNRFAYYDRIETDCVLQLDDDLAATKEEIEFGFRVWREERDRLISYAVRKRVKGADGIGSYDGTSHCSHELGLTGYAFLHKKYMYEYTQFMPAAIREYVDEHHNCEDIAMNYLVAHLTRKAPLRLSKNHLIEYPNNKGGLSTKGDHYKRRSSCIQFFTNAYGYDPLLSSRFQVVAHDPVNAQCSKLN